MLKQLCPNDAKTWQVANFSMNRHTNRAQPRNSNLPQRALIPINAHQCTNMSHTHLVVGVTPFTIRKMDSVAPSWILCRNTCINCATAYRKGKNELTQNKTVNNKHLDIYKQ